MMDDDQLNNHQERPRDRFAAFVLLDSRNRLEAIERSIPDPEERARSVLKALESANVVHYDVDPYDYVISASLHRRHLTVAQKRQLVAALLLATTAIIGRRTRMQVGKGTAETGPASASLSR
jgi:hypothetical protein